MPLHGTFFFNRGVCAGRALVGFGGVLGVSNGGAWSDPFGLFRSVSIEDRVPASKGEPVDRILKASCDAFPTPKPSIFALFTRACFNVSLLERALGRRGTVWFEAGTGRAEARGVLGSTSSNQAASSPDAESLNEECSLSSVPSLSQWRCSEAKSLVVCCRIQSSVSPRTGLLARLASIAALPEREG